MVNLPPPEVVELTNQKTLEEQCDGKQLCIVGFLPHILDSQVCHIFPSFLIFPSLLSLLLRILLKAQEYFGCG